MRNTCVKIAGKITTEDLLSMRYALEAVNEGFDEDFVKACEIETENLQICSATKDANEALT